MVAGGGWVEILYKSTSNVCKIYWVGSFCLPDFQERSWYTCQWLNNGQKDPNETSNQINMLHKKYGVRFTYIYKNIHCVCTANQNRKIYSPTAFKGILNIISKYTVIKIYKKYGVRSYFWVGSFCLPDFQERSWYTDSG